ncbi:MULTISPECIES: helix-turn-helix domain-containing protein [Streptomyces]|uniref:helix-turn-helix domain-containing protein n=1 Tax=Streptomyces TaxID=1883 RepID=UPI00200CE17B|nr:helix-turn-helix domain-containing protein [Streptomyces virginiae]
MRAGPSRWQGLGRDVETCVAAHRDCLRNPSPSGLSAEATRLASGRPQDDPAPAGRRAERKKAAHALVHELLAQGHSRQAIARHLGWGLNTVLRYANAARWQDTIRDNRPRPPTVRQVTGWLTRHPTMLSEDDRAGLKDVLPRCPELDTAAGHVRDFGEILTGRLGATLPAWIDAVDASQLSGLTGFALHLLRKMILLR